MGGGGGNPVAVAAFTACLPWVQLTLPVLSQLYLPSYGAAKGAGVVGEACGGVIHRWW